MRPFPILILLLLAALSPAAALERLGTPIIGIEQSGSCRALTVRDQTNAADVTIGCLDTSGHSFRLLGDVGSMVAKVPDAPVAPTIAQVVADVAILRSYGYRADGFSHPLSSLFSSLVAAKLYYPHAQALTDEVDGIAIQGVINRYTGSTGIKIILPAGVASINRPIVTGSAPIEFEGQGWDATRLTSGTSGMDMFQHGLSSVVYGATFTLRHLGIYTTAYGPRYAINIRQNMNSGGFILDRVKVASYSAAFGWYGYVNGYGNTNTNWRDVVMSGGEYNDAANQAQSTQIGVRFTSNDTSDHSFVYAFDNIQVGAVQNAFLFTIGGTTPDVHGSIEGVQFTRSGGRVDTGAWLKLSHPGAATTGWYPPYWIFDSCNMEGPGALLDFDSVSEIFITKNLMYIDPVQAGGGAPNYINFGRVLRANILNNTLASFAGASLGYFIAVGAGSTDVLMRDNVFHVDGATAALAGGIYNAPGNKNIRAFDNVYEGPPSGTFANTGAWPAGVPKEKNFSGGGNGNIFTAALAQMNSASQTATVDRQTGRITLTGNYTGTTNSSSVISIPLPPGLFSSEIRQVTASNGDAGASAFAIIVPYPGAGYSPSGVSVYAIDSRTGAAIGSGVSLRVNYTIEGL